MSRHLLITLTLLAGSGPAALASTNVMTLEDCLALGRERSITMANTMRERRIADENIRGIRAQALPSLNTDSQFSRLGETVAYPGFEGVDNRDQYTASVTAEQLLYSGGSVRAALRAAKSFRTQADEEVARIDALNVRQISTAFFNVLFREATVRVARESVDQLAHFEQEARLKYQGGAISEFEWLSAQVSLANENPRLVEAENQRDIARSVLRNLLYLDDDAWSLTFDWDTRTTEVSLASLQEAGLTNRWELKQARENLAILEADIKVTEGEYLPEVKAFATYQGADPSTYNPVEDGWDWQWVAGVRASWNILDGGARSSVRIEKRLQKEIATDAIIDLEREVLLEIETAYRNLQQSLRILEGARDTIRLAEKALSISRLRFERGLATNLEFTDRNLELNRARIQHLAGLLAYHTALADLQYASGTDTVTKPQE
jgi:outer membrane protein TolC